MRVAIPLRLNIQIVSGKATLFLLLFILASQPFGSPMALVFYLFFGLIAALIYKVPARPVGIFLIWLSFLIVTGLFSAAFIPVNPLLIALYATYLTFLIFCGTLIYSKITSMDEIKKDALIAWIQILDLVFNLPAILIQLTIWGPGDMIQGLCGLLLGDALSQNRTNSVRAGFLIILALVRLSRRKNSLSKFSLIFNFSVLLLATSMTTIFSILLTFGIMLLSRRNSLRFLPHLIALGLVAFVADDLNRLIFSSTSVFQFLLSINTRWIPKLDIYYHYFTIVIEQNPISLFFGNGIGNFSNRFVILANFQNYAKFPFKEAISNLLHSQLTETHLINHYYLETGILWNSIISVPWSGILGMISEFGFLGILFLFIIGHNWIKEIIYQPLAEEWNYGIALIMFLFFNLFFDCYLDYPEVFFPFIIIAGCIAKKKNRKLRNTYAQISK